MMNVRIHGGPATQGLKIETEDGQPIKGITSLEIRVVPHDIVRATFELLPKYVDITAEAIFIERCPCCGRESDAR
jgi:hypothetical protein